MTDGMNSQDAKPRSPFSWIGLVFGLTLGGLLSVTPGALLWWLAVVVGTIIGLANRSRLVATMGLASAAVMVIATALPTKYEDRRVGPLKSPNLTVGELVEAGLAYEPREPAWALEAIRLDSLTPRRRDLIQAINHQTSLRARYFACGTGDTCWAGAKGGRMILSSKNPIPVASNSTASADK